MNTDHRFLLQTFQTGAGLGRSPELASHQPTSHSETTRKTWAFGVNTTWHPRSGYVPTETQSHLSPHSWAFPGCQLCAKWGFIPSVASNPHTNQGRTSVLGGGGARASHSEPAPLTAAPVTPGDPHQLQALQAHLLTSSTPPPPTTPSQNDSTNAVFQLGPSSSSSKTVCCL